MIALLNIKVKMLKSIIYIHTTNVQFKNTSNISILLTVYNKEK